MPGANSSSSSTSSHDLNPINPIASSIPLNVLEKYEFCITHISPEVSEHKSGKSAALVSKLTGSVVVTHKGYLAISRCSFLVSRYTFTPISL
ncbi:hypothetical protein EJD97_010639 [Solanum chilense]|uniref:Uncharacterized protein n=1 Tax=Solanum chilense TaxID=4083 RepID=A0A6N2BH98_SOLCI|nr:hypothetical protein EJD97_010639 [Solanum chilense]